jgi:hypothetical protein
MLKPLLIIGLGGSGGKTIRAMKQSLNRTLESVRYTGGLPAAWQFLQIDTTVDGIDFPAPMLPPDEIHTVVPNGANFDEVLASITGKGNMEEQHRMLTGWGIPYSAISIKDGAGQTRAIGRQVGVADSAKTLQAIVGSIAKMSAPTAYSELAELATKLGAKAPNAVPQAFIISSIAGGSGAGMFMDVAELLKRATPKPWGQEAISFLYTAEVFNSLGSSGANVSKNSLGAMNELIASKWVSVSERSDLLYQKLGLVPGNTSGNQGYGCKGNILVGASNKTGVNIAQGVDGAGMDEVFLTIGEALAGAVSNDNISEFLFQQAFVNITQTRSAIDVSGLAPGNPQNPTLAAAGIGFGQLTLGADRIVDYVADALTKSQVEMLLWPELNPTLLSQGKSKVELINEAADKLWANFLLESGVDERGSQDQILDALRSPESKTSVKQFVNGMIKKVVSKDAIPVRKFANDLSGEWATSVENFLISEKKQISDNAKNWVPSVQESFRDLIARELMRNGFEVVTNLISRLETELKDNVIHELLQHHNDDAEKVKGFNDQVLAKGIIDGAEGLSGVNLQNGQFLEKVSLTLNRKLESYINSHVNAFAASLVQDMLMFFIVPLKEQLANARFKLQTEQRATITASGSKNSYLDFPDWGSGIVPERYKPRTIERILIDVSEYESTYELYASRDSEGVAPYKKSIGSSLLGKKMNPPQGDPNPQTLVTESSPWITSVRDAQRDEGAPVTKVVWTFHTDLEELSQRNHKWLKHEDSAFGQFTNKSIREFVGAVGESPETISARELKFVREYSAMLGLAQPLVLLNPNALQHILSAKDGGNASGIMLKSSRIPFAISSNVGQACTLVLQQNGFNPADPSFEQDWFSASANDTSMFAAATTQASLPAWAFASLTQPILAQVALSKNDADTWIQFWEGRRSRPLIECIPFETEMRRSIITGWFIATLFGMRNIGSIAEGRTVTLWNPTLQVPGLSTFPSPLLNSHHEDLSRDTWVLPQLLVSAGIALAEFGFTGKAESINGYRLLKYLGREVTTSLDKRDKWDANGAGDMLPNGLRSKSTYLRDWVASGVLPSSELKLSKTLEKIVSLNPDRGEALKEYVEKIASEYKGIWDKFAKSEWHMLPETWELKEDIDFALRDISNYVQNLEVTTATTSE